MTHEEIRQLLVLRETPDHGCEEVNAVLDAHIGHVASRLRSLRSLQTQLKAIRARCNGPGPVRACGVIQGLESMSHPGPDAGSGAVHRSKPC